MVYGQVNEPPPLSFCGLVQIERTAPGWMSSLSRARMCTESGERMEHGMLAGLQFDSHLCMSVGGVLG